MSKNKLVELGLTATERVRGYAETQSQRDLNALFKILVEIGSIIVHNHYRRVDPVTCDDAVYRIAEDILMTIAKKPKNYCEHNLYYYYRHVVQVRMNRAVKESYGARDNLISLNEVDEESLDRIAYTNFESPLEGLSIRDEYKLFIRRVSRKLNSCYRFRKQSKYLIWPIVISLIYEDGCLFDNLDYRDRVALRIMQCFPRRRVPLYSPKSRFAMYHGR